MLFLRKIFLLACIFVLTPDAAISDENGIVVMGFIEFPPYYYTKGSGEVAGTLIDLAKNISAQAGYSIKFKSLPPKRAIKMVAGGEVDLWFGLGSIADYKHEVLRSNEPVAHINVCLFTPKPLDVAPVADGFLGDRVVVIRGYTYGGLLAALKLRYPSTYILEVGTHEQALKALVGRHMDSMLGYKLPMEMVLKQSKEKNTSQVPLYSYPLDQLDVYLIVPKRTENSKQLLESFWQAFISLRAAMPPDPLGVDATIERQQP